jgi:hypothetical protein
MTTSFTDISFLLWKHKIMMNLNNISGNIFLNHYLDDLYLVRERRLELLWVYPLDPKSSASANSATLAKNQAVTVYIHYPWNCQHQSYLDTTDQLCFFYNCVVNPHALWAIHA